MTEKNLVSLLFDTILFEKSFFIGTTAVFRGTADQVHVSFTELAKAFDIAQDVCRLCRDTQSNNALSAPAFESQLKEAGLNVAKCVEEYVHRIDGCNGIFLPKTAQSTASTTTTTTTTAIDEKQEGSTGEDLDHKGLAPPKIGFSTDGIDLPVLDSTYRKQFDERYVAAGRPGNHDMIARIVLRLRRDLWNQTIPAGNLDRVDTLAIYHYGSRWAQMKRDSASKTKQKAAKAGTTSDRAVRPTSSADYAAKIAHRLVGLHVRENDRPTYGLQGEFELPVVAPISGAYERVSASMMAFYQRLVPSNDSINKRSLLVRRLQRILDTAFPSAGLRLEMFGSYASGLGSESSDADLCITSDSFRKSAPYNDMRMLASVLRRGGMIKVQAISNARVPIVKFVDPNTRINCDINANHVLGIHNSKLIRCYTKIDDRVHPLLYCLKALVKKHKINDSSQSSLSSYAYVMMAIGFLQAQDPPVLPALQAQPEECLTPLFVQLDHEGRGGRDLINCTFDHDVTRYQGFGSRNTKSVGQLLVEFFEFYTRYYDYQTMEVNVRFGGVRVRDEITRARNAKPGSKLRVPQRGHGEKKLVVMDPFIRDRNVSGSCQSRHLTRVWRIFESIYFTLSHGEFQRAFDLVPERYGEEVPGQQPPMEQQHKVIMPTGPAASASNPGALKKQYGRPSSVGIVTAPKPDNTTMTSADGTRNSSVQQVTHTIGLLNINTGGDHGHVAGATKSKKQMQRTPVAQGYQAERASDSIAAASRQHRERTLQSSSNQQNRASSNTNPQTITAATDPESQAARRIVQTSLLKALSDQKRHNDLLDQKRHNDLLDQAQSRGSSIGAGATAKPKYQAENQAQQMNLEFPVLTKTHKLLHNKTKNPGTGGPTGSNNNNNNGNRYQGNNNGSEPIIKATPEYGA
ncbi:hypothetical protein BG011_004378 [Mortierella polycephala]|uniref:polynucleotide adenylyltransferase n=1 Tax=Mortierella polycephala TaxID=41804 RepID=A0A9P6Q119_9FUNG|nr:hypothetical protein BG011_004378 [Mortierella polycephala]